MKAQTVNAGYIVTDGSARPAVAMDARYASQCAGNGQGHDADCPGSLSKGQRIIYVRETRQAYSLHCADWHVTPVLQWSGKETFKFTGRPVPADAGI